MAEETNEVGEMASTLALPLQEGMVFHAMAHPASGVDIEQVGIVLQSALAPSVITAAWELVADRHPILRTSFIWSSANMEQVAAPSTHVPTVTADWSDEADLATAMEAHQRADRVVDFDLQTPPLQRLFVADLGDRGTWILWTFHHSLLDGRSFPLVLKEVFDHLDGLEPPALSGPTFDDFGAALLNQDLDQGRAFWREYLAPVESPSSIVGFGGAAGTAEVRAVERRLSSSSTAQLRVLAEHQDLTLNSLIQSAWILLTHHYSQQRQVVIGTTRACRHFVPGSDSTIGLLINTVPLSVEVTPELTVLELAAATRAEQLRLREGETTPLSEIQNMSSLGSTPLFNSIVMFDDATLNTRMKRIDPDRFGDRTFTYTGQTNFDLTLLAYGEDELLLRLEFALAQFSTERAQTLLDQIELLLGGFVDDPNQKAVAVQYMTKSELDQLDEWNSSDKPYDLSKALHTMFEEQVERTPDREALRYSDQSLTYAEFNSAANRLAHHLQTLNLNPDQRVGVCVERSIEMMVGIYAILKAGAAYVPLDPDNPADRLEFMAGDSEISVVLTQSHLLGKIDQDCVTPALTIIDLDAPSVWAENSEENLGLVVAPDHLAYTLYTSGSTGRPKGAMNEHQGIVNRLIWMQEAFNIGADDTVLQKTPYSFDVSVWELFWPLQVGARLVIAPPNAHRDPSQLIDLIVSNDVTTMHFVPSMLQLFLEDSNVSQCDSLQRVVCSGEALTRDLCDRFFAQLPATQLHNLYGPTEAAVDVTWWECDPESTSPTVPIGKTIANTQMHVLDPQLQRLPVGVAGELHIGGIQVARGYVSRPELTAERFLADPFNPGGRLYKTGDLARIVDDGIIEYLGRLDFQVKLRGLRIELGEIEAVLASHPSVREVIVTAHGMGADQRLVAYVVGSDIDTSELEAHGGQFMAEYMVPSDWVVLPKFELNSSGKVDRKKLPAPTVSRSVDVVAPRSSVESDIREVWLTLLEVDNVGVTESFFAVGGNSLSLVRLATRLTERLGVDIEVSQLLRKVTVAEQAELVNELVSNVDVPDALLASGAELARKQRQARAKRRKPRTAGGN